MTGDRTATEVSTQLRRARNDLMAGRGAGASDLEVAAQTRDRVMIAGETATRRLELAARQAGYARRDPAAIARTVQLTQSELADTLAELARRVHPRRLRSASRKAIRRQLRTYPMLYILASAGVLLGIRRLLR